MNPHEAIYLTQYRLDKARRERDHDRLVNQAKGANRATRIFRFFPLRSRESAPSTD